MKQSSLTSIALLFMAITFTLFSCSKSELSKPAVPQQSVNSTAEEANVVADPASIVGLYRVTSFIENRKNETSRFRGYRFDFQSDSDFVARTSSRQIVEGTWMLDTTGTVLQIDISGTGALDRVVGEWKIETITSTSLVLINEDRDKLVFTRIEG